MDDELKKDKTKELDFMIAPPRMSHYINFSAKIYNIYLNTLPKKISSSIPSMKSLQILPSI